jgi:type I restriction enzyme R subunit
LVKDLDTAALKNALKNFNGTSRNTDLRFRVAPIGRFDAALVPIGPAGEAPDRWLLVLEEALPLRDQVALYAHALGHLSLNRDAKQMGRVPPLDPRAGYTHTELLGELRQLEQTRSPVDRRVLETYPALASLLQIPEERGAALSFVAPDFRERLGRFGWRGSLVASPYIFTDGRIFISGAAIRRGPKLREDALLRAEASVPIALVHLLRTGEPRADAERRLIDYARDRLYLPFAYLLEDDGTVHEFDWTASREAAPTRLAALPSRDELWLRWTSALGLSDAPALDALKYPYDLSAGHRPRYYQEAAINRAVAAVLQAKRGQRQPRLLLTLATGTGKTLIAFEIVWKLKKQARAVKNVLFLTDRDYLLKQAMDNDFAPFGDARYRIHGGVHTSHDVLFATYQAIADQEGRAGLYRGYPRNFFDLIIVDECHRGSAQDDANWRAILDYFDSAVQIGMTATPQKTENIQTYAYFGKPLVTYSLRQGINDGFLAPYRVRRVLLGTAAEAESDALAAAFASDEATGNAADLALPLPSRAVMRETGMSLHDRTGVIAEHLAKYLHSTDPMAKTIIFCVDQPHAEKMRLALAERCPVEVRRFSDYLVRIVSEEGDDGKRALGRFSTPDEPRPVVVTTSKLLSTGVDVPTCKLIVLARPINSMVEFKQIIGRGTRLHEKKQWFTIIDYAGATHHFFDQEFDGDPELVEVEPVTPEPPQVDVTPPTSNTEDEQPAASPAATNGAAQPAAAGEAGYLMGDTAPSPQGTIKDGAASYSQNEAGAAAQPQTAPPVRDAGAQPEEPPTAPVDSPGQQQSEAPTTNQENSVQQAQEKKHTDSPLPLPPIPPGAKPVQTSSGRRFLVKSEILYELGPDGSTLQAVSYQNYTKDTLQKLCTTPAELRARWLRQEQREEIKERLIEEGIDLDQLAETLRLPDADLFDLLLHVAFGERPLTRRERADRLKREHAAFFERYGPAAREILDTILEKYLAGEAEDVSDTGWLKVPPLSGKGTFIELAQRFGGGEQVRQALREMQTLLYSA